MHMNDWKLALFSGLSQASGMEDIIDTAAAAARRYDFDYCGWKILLSPPSAQQMVLTVASADEEMFDQIVGENNAVSSHSERWSGMARCELDEKASALVSDSSPFGIHSRWVHAAQDTRTGAYCIFYANSLTPLSQQQLQQAEADMQWVAAAVHAGMFHIPVRQKQTLTLREQSILTLIGEGLALDDIADQMRLTLETTAFHLESAEYKLQTPDHYQAAAKALFFGLLG